VEQSEEIIDEISEDEDVSDSEDAKEKGDLDSSNEESDTSPPPQSSSNKFALLDDQDE